MGTHTVIHIFGKPYSLSCELSGSNSHDDYKVTKLVLGIKPLLKS